MRIHDVPATTGYGEPVQKFFKMDDGEKIVAMHVVRPRVLEVPPAGRRRRAEPLPPYRGRGHPGKGLAFRFSLSCPSRSFDEGGPAASTAS